MQSDASKGHRFNATAPRSQAPAAELASSPRPPFTLFLEPSIEKTAAPAAIAALVVIAWGTFARAAPRGQLRARQAAGTGEHAAHQRQSGTYQWQSVRAETAGLVGRVSVSPAETVDKDANLAEMSDPALAAEVEAAEAKVAEARANLSALQSGGRPSDLADIQNNLARAQLDLETEM